MENKDILEQIVTEINENPCVTSTKMCNDFINISIVDEQMKQKITQTPIREPLTALISRIRDINKYINVVKENKPKTYVELTSLIMQIDILVSCIRTLNKIFCKKDIKGSVNIFKNKEKAISRINKEKGETSKTNITDSKYFKYIRSIGFAHPIDTNRHSEFQNGELEWSMYVDPVSRGKMLCDGTIADFAIRVCHSGSNIDKIIPLVVDEFIEYADYYYNKLNIVLEKIQKNIKKWKKSLINEPVKSVESFDTYIEYLIYLNTEIEKRNLDSYELEKVMIIFLIDMDSTHNNLLLDKYKKKLKYKVSKLHELIQNMENDEDFRLLESVGLDEFDCYDIEKLSYLTHFCEESGMKISKKKLNKNTKYIGIKNLDELKVFISEEFNELKKNELNKICNNSEWTRVLFHKYSNEMSQYIDLDFFKSDWNVYIQIYLYALIKIGKLETYNIKNKEGN